MNKRNPIKANVSGIRETEKTYGRRENGFYREVAAIDPATGAAVVTARFYYPGATCYCALWLSGGGKYGRGNGKAGGGGYHKPSVALANAIVDAGIALSQSINGVGDTAMTDAVDAIARAMTGKRRFIIHTAHA